MPKPTHSQSSNTKRQASLAGIHDELISEVRLPVVIWSNVDSPLDRGRSEIEQIHALVDLRVEGIILSPVVYEAKKLRIPEELSVVGYGNDSISTHVVPGMTTVDQHAYDIGTSAARRLLLRIGDSAERSRKVLLPCDLVVRQSTAGVRGS